MGCSRVLFGNSSFHHSSEELWPHISAPRGTSMDILEPPLFQRRGRAPVYSQGEGKLAEIPHHLQGVGASTSETHTASLPSISGSFDTLGIEPTTTRIPAVYYKPHGHLERV